jgi:HD-GYP domain-containing protein (c-di-GMP phosphodiesterase class II)
MEQEVARAATICAKAGRQVASLFQEARMGKAIHVETVLPVVEEIARSVERNPGVLAALLRLRKLDNYTYMHSVSVCALMVALGNQIGLGTDPAREAGMAGLLHDIGKVGIATELLNKKGSLSDQEFALLRDHAQLGHQLLIQSGGAGDVVLDVCLHHHERADGSGYPDRLAADAISVYAKMAAVCDVYDATTSNRPYKAAWQAAYALRKMTEWSHGHFDMRIFHAFVRTVGIYPIGTLVRLKSGYLGVVLDQNEDSLLAPRVKVFYAIDKDRRVPPKVVDLSLGVDQDEIISHEDPDVWDIKDLQFLWSGIDGPVH